MMVPVSSVRSIHDPIFSSPSPRLHVTKAVALSATLPKRRNDVQHVTATASPPCLSSRRRTKTSRRRRSNYCYGTLASVILVSHTSRSSCVHERYPLHRPHIRILQQSQSRMSLASYQSILPIELLSLPYVPHARSLVQRSGPLTS